MGSKRRWGYLVWGVAGAVIAVPEITAAVDSGALPFTTISAMVGHLERHHNWVELIVVAAIVFAVFSTVRVPPRTRSGVARATTGQQPIRTPGGRLTLRAPTRTAAAAEFDEEDASWIFMAAAVLSAAVVAAATWAVSHWCDDVHHYRPAYALYGLLGLLWLVVPSVLAFGLGRDMPFPTLFRTVNNLEEWLRSRSWPLSLGPLLGWLVAYVILAGLVILLLHLTLYPYPNITKILNPNG